MTTYGSLWGPSDLPRTGAIGNYAATVIAKDNKGSYRMLAGIGKSSKANIGIVKTTSPITIQIHFASRAMCPSNQGHSPLDVLAKVLVEQINYFFRQFKSRKGHATQLHVQTCVCISLAGAMGARG